MSFDIKWRDEEVIKLCEENAEEIMREFALTAEGEAKKELKKEHGVVTGTLRRSIHAESTDYDFSKDNVDPSESSPERGGKEFKPSKEEHKVMAALGSGLVYAMRIHQGWGKFPGYHYLTIGVDRAKAKLSAIIARHQVSE